MDCRLLELPLDVLRIIWSYLSLPDVVRFGLTAKNMMDRIWPFYQRIVSVEEWPIEALTFVLSRDLTHARELDLYYSAEEEDLNDDILSSIATKKAPNLLELTTEVEFPDYANMIRSFNTFIQSQTQLQKLNWYNAKVDSNFNIGQFLSGHMRLAELAVESRGRQNLRGLNLLTTLKKLVLNLCNFDNDIFTDVMNLTQLVSLKFFPISVDDHAFTNITKLTNMEQFFMGLGQTPIKSSSLTALLELPKLTDFKIHYYNRNFPEEYSTAISIIAQLTNLTSLKIDASMADLDLGRLTTLTNLLHMDIASGFNFVDLSSFQHLTSLTLVAIKPQEFKKIQSLPPNLKELILAAFFKLSDSDIEVVCNLKNLEELQLQGSHDSYMVANWSIQITRLTNLNSLVVVPYASKELIMALERLPNLANVRFRRVPNEIINDLAKLTQLLTLTYWDERVKDLQQKLPFKVVFEH